MNRTVIILGFFCLIGIGLVGSALLLLFRPEASAQFISQITIVLGLAVTSAVTLSGIDKVAKNTNGRMGELIEAVRDVLVARKATHEQIERLTRAAESFTQQNKKG